MRLYHIALAVLVSCIWGFNFVVAQTGLADVSPFVLCSARFFFASVPLVFFVKRPAVSFKWLFAYGLVNFALQYTLLFSGMLAGMPAGLTSLLYQSQVFFTLALAFIFFKEKPTRLQLVGILVAVSGIVIVGFNKGSDFSVLGFILVMSGAMAWAAGNIISKKIGKVNMLGLVVWGNFIAWPPVFLLTYYIDGKEEIMLSLKNMSDLSMLAIFYIAYLSTIVAFSLWNWMLTSFPVAAVVPFTLLVPVVGMISSALVFDEPWQLWKIGAGALILCGIAINVFGPRLLQKSSSYFGDSRSKR